MDDIKKRRVIHSNLSVGRWFELSAMEQLGNIGSEVERALRSHEAGADDRFESAFGRTLELIHLTVTDPKWKFRLKELLRIREVFCDYLLGENTYSITPDQLKKDFLRYGIAARMDINRTRA